MGSKEVPVIGNRRRVAGVGLGRHRVRDVLVVGGRIQDLKTARIGALQDGISKLPDRPLLFRLQRRNGGEVVDVDGADQPTTTTETGQVRGRLQQSTQMARGGRVFRATVKGLDRTGAVHQSPVATSRHGDTDIGQSGRVVSDGVDVRDRVIVVHLDMTEEILHRLDGVVPALLQP